jgi:hypothetical protein
MQRHTCRSWFEPFPPPWHRNCQSTVFHWTFTLETSTISTPVSTVILSDPQLIHPLEIRHRNCENGGLSR